MVVFSIVALLAVVEPSTSASADPSSVPASAEVEPMDQAAASGDAPADQSGLRSDHYYRIAIEHHDEGRVQEAALSVVKAYRFLGDQKFDVVGLAVMQRAVQYNIAAYDQRRDPVRLAAIHPLLEQFLENYGSYDDELSSLRRKLAWVRSERVLISKQLLRDGDYISAAVEAETCYGDMVAAARGSEIGERAVLVASEAHREAWYEDGDIRHLIKAAGLLDDHSEYAFGETSGRLRAEQGNVRRLLAVARVRGGAVEQSGGARGLSGVTRRDRALLMGAGAGLFGGFALSVGSGVVGSSAVRLVELRNRSDGLAINGRELGVAIGMSAVGGAVSGVATHALVDAGLLAPRSRKIVGVSGVALGLAATVAGATLMAIGNSGDANSQRRTMTNVGLGLVLGVSTPMGAGISALVSRQAGG